MSVAISMSDNGLFDYTEPTLRTAVVIAIAAEVAAIVLLLAYLVTQHRPTAKRINWTER